LVLQAADHEYTFKQTFLMKSLAAGMLLLFLWLTTNAQTVTYYCGFCRKGPYYTYEAAREHTCATHNWGCTPATVIPAGPSAEELKKMREEKDLKEASIDANDRGAECYKQRDWACAIKYFKEALDLDPDNDDAIYN